MTLQVIGAGVGRTGTSSLTAALSMLLGGACYHFEEVIQHPEHVEFWRRATRGEPVDWDQLYAPYVATMDWPGAAFWQPLAATYPEALVLLSVRRSAAEWYDSAAQTIGTLVGHSGAWRNEKDGPWLDMAGELLRTRFVPAPFDRAEAEAAYERHNAEVRASVPAERLLEWRPGDGWEPICERLGVAVPAQPFPHLNTQTDFRASLSEAAEAAPGGLGKAKRQLTELARRAMRRGRG